MSSKNSTNTANTLWQRQPKCNAEFFALTYGALVSELLRDLESASAVTAELDRMGHSIGIRCIEEVLAKQPASTAAPQSFPATAELCSTALRMLFGVTVEIQHGDSSSSSGDATGSNNTTVYKLLLSENPLMQFVEVPENLKDTLQYSQLLAGLLRGLLEVLQLDVNVTATSTSAESCEITVTLQQVLQEGAGDDYHEE